MKRYFVWLCFILLAFQGVSLASDSILGFPRDIISSYSRYEDAFVQHNFHALKALLAPDFAIVRTGKSESTEQSLSDLRMIGLFDERPTKISMTSDLKSSVRLCKVFIKGKVAVVLLGQDVLFSVSHNHQPVYATGSYFWKQTWLKTPDGWTLWRMTDIPELHSQQALKLY